MSNELAMEQLKADLGDVFHIQLDVVIDLALTDRLDDLLLQAVERGVDRQHAQFEIADALENALIRDGYNVERGELHTDKGMQRIVMMLPEEDKEELRRELRRERR